MSLDPDKEELFKLYIGYLAVETSPAESLAYVHGFRINQDIADRGTAIREDLGLDVAECVALYKSKFAEEREKAAAERLANYRREVEAFDRRAEEQRKAKESE